MWKTWSKKSNPCVKQHWVQIHSLQLYSLSRKHTVCACLPNPLIPIRACFWKIRLWAMPRAERQITHDHTALYILKNINLIKLTVKQWWLEARKSGDRLVSEDNVTVTCEEQVLLFYCIVRWIQLTTAYVSKYLEDKICNVLTTKNDKWVRCCI